LNLSDTTNKTRSRDDNLTASPLKKKKLFPRHRFRNQEGHNAGEKFHSKEREITKKIPPPPPHILSGSEKNSPEEAGKQQEIKNALAQTVSSLKSTNRRSYAQINRNRKPQTKRRNCYKKYNIIWTRN